MQKWSYFSTGILSGIITVLLTVVILQNREPQAHAVAPRQGVEDGNLILGIGGSLTQQYDIAWVLWNHDRLVKPEPGADARGQVTARDKSVTLASYQVANGGRSIKLVGVRDITYDLDLVEYHNEKPSVKEIVEELKKAMPAPPKK